MKGTPCAAVSVCQPRQVRALGQATAWCEALTQGEREAGLKARGEA